VFVGGSDGTRVRFAAGHSDCGQLQSPFEIFIDPAVPQDLVASIRQTINGALAYYQSALGRTRTQPGRVFILPSSSAVWTKYAEIYGISIESAQREFGQSLGRGCAGPNRRDVWMHVDDPGIRNRARGYLERVLSHELFHSVQCEFANFVPRRGFVWIDEGTADFMGYRVIDAMRIITWSTSRSELISRVVRSGMTGQVGLLRRAETEFGPLSQSFPMYPYTALAADFLVGDNLGSIRRFFEKLGVGMEWRDSFRESFGITVEDFYAKWDAHIRTLR
jgi:hypothetical protein